MNARIPVKDRKEAQEIRRALEDPETRAMVRMLGVLLPLSSRERQRVLTFAYDSVQEQLGL